MEHDNLINALNLIDEQAEQGNPTGNDAIERSKAYTIVANFIDKHAKR